MPRANHIAVNKMIASETQLINDKALFSSRALEGYLTDVANGMLIRKKLSETLDVKLVWDEGANSPVGFTDGRQITINTGNKFFDGQREEKWNLTKGVLLHEVGHIFYTDFNTANTFSNSFMHGRIEIPKQIQCPEVQDLADYLHTILNESIREKLLEECMDVSNYIEDAYLENNITFEFQGYSKPMFISRDRKYMRLNTLNDVRMKKFEVEEYASLYRFKALLLSYALFAEFKGESWELQKMDEGIKILNSVADIDYCLTIDDSKLRFEQEIQVMSIMLPYLKKYGDYLLDKYGNNPVPKDAAGTSVYIPGSTAIPFGRTSTGQQATLGQQATSEQQATPGDANGNDANAAGNTDNKLAEKSDDANDNAGGVTSDATASDNNEAGRPVPGGRQSFSDEKKKHGPCENGAEDMKRLLDEIAKKNAYNKYEKNLSDELKSFAASINHSSIHDGYPCDIERVIEPSQKLIDGYYEVEENLKKISKRLQGNLVKILEKRRKGSKQTNLYMGRRLEVRAIPRNDGRVFSSRKNPSDKPKIAVCHLIDQSDSMGGTRIAAARCTEFILYDFCRALKIPHACYGHNTYGDTVSIESYVEFNSIDERDKYRIMGIHSGGCNRDGYALRFAAERLYNQNADIKLLIITSDGAPNHSGYGGKTAYEDLSSIKKEYQRKGILLITAAIGDDKEIIESIYGTEHFLNVEDPNRLPELLTDLIKKLIKIA